MSRVRIYGSVVFIDRRGILSLPASKQKDLEYFQNALEALAKYSPRAKVFCLIHKMDRIPEELRQRTFQIKSAHRRLLRPAQGG